MTMEKLYKMVNGNSIELSESEYQEYYDRQPTLEEEKQTKKGGLIAPRLFYLQKTDWFFAREFDEPNSYPQEIKTKRILARKEINDIQACTTLTALNEFSTDF
jgi:hypothetical protein